MANGALTAASDVVDSYVAASYTLPLTQASPLLTDITVDLARHRLYAGKASDEVQARYDAAMKWLRDVSSGKAKLPGVAGQEPVARTGMVQSASEGRLFTRTKLRAF